MSRAPDTGLRDHYIYRAYDRYGVLLYVGSTMRPNARFRDHHGNRNGDSRWYLLMHVLRMRGPYTKQEARRMEREVIATEHPLYNQVWRTFVPREQVPA